jgi:hypothetical protein
MLYFAYGSNMDESQMAKRCPDVKLRNITQLNGYEFFIDAKGVASVREQRGKSVVGLRYEISDADEAKLDRYEGVPTHYTKIQLPQIESFCYISTSPQGDAPRKDYLENIVSAAETHRFPNQYISELRSWYSKRQF